MTEPICASLLTDRDLIARLLAQDSPDAEPAFNALFDRYSQNIRTHLLKIVRSEPAAEDLLQEVFLRIWQHADQWNSQAPVKAWIYRIATNQAFNYLRSLQRRPELSLNLPGEGHWDESSDDEEPLAPGWLIDQSTLGPQAALEVSERSAALRRVLAGLPEDKREVLRLVHEMELSIREAAGRLGIPEGTVKSRLHYAQKKLSQEWQTQEEANQISSTT